MEITVIDQPVSIIIDPSSNFIYIISKIAEKCYSGRKPIKNHG